MSPELIEGTRRDHQVLAVDAVNNCIILVLLAKLLSHMHSELFCLVHRPSIALSPVSNLLYTAMSLSS